MTIQEILEKIPIPPPRKCGEVLEKKWRLKTYLHFLKVADNTSSAQETLDLINSKLIEVENCHSGILAAENPGLTYNGRMYPIMDDKISKMSDGRIIALTSGNKIIIEATGEFVILNRLDETPILIKKYDN